MSLEAGSGKLSSPELLPAATTAAGSGLQHHGAGTSPRRSGLYTAFILRNAGIIFIGFHYKQKETDNDIYRYYIFMPISGR